VPLSSGSRLGHYEITASLGAGGMGEVYRARDTRLNRQVAIKVLRSELAGSEDARRRFEREARAVSTLNHPHICALYDVGSDNGIDFLVLEHLEGETLSDRLHRGALPLEEALRLAMQIMSALEAAHRSGVIHRDLKPGNIMLTRHGVKLLDFGLARLKPAPGPAVGDGGSAPQAAAANTMTAEASVMGTVPYMSPEQVEGEEADARSDIFSAGIVIYRMVTGRMPFEGKTSAATLAAILKSEPQPMSASVPGVPRALDRLVGECLAKKRDDRIQSAHDAVLNLQWIRESLGAPESAGVQTSGAFRGARFAWIAAGVAVAALITTVLLMRGSREAPLQDTLRFALEFPPGMSLEEPYWSHPAISPDGRTLALIAHAGEMGGLWIRPLDAQSARLLPLTQGAMAPFWSPDSRLVGFFADGKLKAVAPGGGAPQTICELPSLVATGTWSQGGTIVVQIDEAPGQDGLYRVSASGGAPTRVTLRDPNGRELTATVFPHFLPDGRLLVMAMNADLNKLELHVASLESGQSVRIAYEGPVVSRFEYAPPGYLLGVGENVLYAQRFDLKSLRFEGKPFSIAEGVMEYYGAALFSVSFSGMLIHGRGEGIPSRITWFDRLGRTQGVVGDRANQESMDLSHDGRRLAVSIMDVLEKAVQIWIYDLPEGAPTRMTSVRGALEFSPVWSPDGRELAYCSPVHDPPNVFRRRLDGSDAEVLVPANGHAQLPCDWSLNAQSLLYVDRNPKTQSDVWVLRMEGDAKPAPWLQTPFNETGARFSPDGRWVAYASDETGKYEVYVRPLRGIGERRRISNQGGLGPRWRSDGKEIFYTNLDAEPGFLAVAVDPSSMEPAGTPALLFRLSTNVRDYDVTQDGERFLVIHDDATGTSSPIHVVVNWAAQSRE
jgi:Tol biopolymer transport system component